MDTDSTGSGGAGRSAPSGLFPTGPPRPAYREPHPVRAGGVLAGLGAGAGWLALFGLLGRDLPGRVWWTLAAGVVAWAAALALARRGDRGAAVGVAVAVAVAWVVAGGAVALYWSVTDRWPLW